MTITSKQKSNRYKFFLDKRRHARFIVKPGINVMTGDKSTILGQVIDISHGGLSFNLDDMDFKTDDEIAICLDAPDNDFIMNDLKIKTVYDIKVSTNEGNDSLANRRCGAQFIELMPGQSLQLDRLITVYSLRPG